MLQRLSTKCLCYILVFFCWCSFSIPGFLTQYSLILFVSPIHNHNHFTSHAYAYSMSVHTDVFTGWQADTAYRMTKEYSSLGPRVTGCNRARLWLQTCVTGNSMTTRVAFHITKHDEGGDAYMVSYLGVSKPECVMKSNSEMRKMLHVGWKLRAIEHGNCNNMYLLARSLSWSDEFVNYDSGGWFRRYVCCRGPSPKRMLCDEWADYLENAAGKNDTKPVKCSGPRQEPAFRSQRVADASGFGCVSFEV